MQSQNTQCEQLNKQLETYRAFRNTQAVAAVLRQMAHVHCPINPKSYI